MTLGKILAEEGHQPPARSLPGMTARHDKTLAGPPGKALSKEASGATARPALTKFSTTTHMQLPDPTSWADTCVATCSSQANSSSACVVACKSS